MDRQSSRSSSEASRFVQPARRAPATPHTPLETTLGVSSMAAWLLLLPVFVLDADGHIGDRSGIVVCLAAVTGLGYVWVRNLGAIRQMREAYRLGRRVERAVAHRGIQR
jgi:hypothetical protein